MTEAPFELRLAESGQRVIVTVVGEVDMVTAPELARTLEAVEPPTELVVIDLTEVSFLDSSALNTLVRCARDLGRLKIGFRVVSPAQQGVRRIFELTSLEERLRLVDSLEQALEADGAAPDQL